MTVRVHEVSVGAFPGLTLRNDSIEATVLPSLGGRIWELWDINKNRQWIWHRPGVELSQFPAGACYDDVWAGGWEQLFPNDAAGAFEGRLLPDHGEWWSAEWRVTAIEEGAVGMIRLEADLQVVRATCIKELHLRATETALEVRYRIVSRESKPFHFLFKEHLPVAVTSNCSLFAGGGRIELVEPGFGNMLASSGPLNWPGDVEGTGRLDRIPDPGERAREFVYLSELAEGRCGVADPDAGSVLQMDFDRTKLPFLWMFLTYGGWRDCYTAVLEPCTNKPKDLSEAVRLRQSACLAPEATFETSVVVTLLEYGITDTEGGF